MSFSATFRLLPFSDDTFELSRLRLFDAFELGDAIIARLCL